SMKMLNVLASSRASPLPQKYSGYTRIVCPLKSHCGSELARDSGGPAWPHFRSTRLTRFITTTKNTGTNTTASVAVIIPPITPVPMAC
ncbi:hypothetical protein SAMN03159481_00222, partial [Pseudomonas sp. NFACC56-3]